MKLTYEPPKKVRYNGVIYEVNDNALDILEAITLMNNDDIDDIERAIIAVVKVFGTKAPIVQGLANVAFQVINNGEQADDSKYEKQSMDLVQDFQVYRMDILREFNHDILKQPTSWNMLRGYIANLSSNSNLHGLSNLRTLDPNDYKDKKQRREIIEMQKKVAIKDSNKKEIKREPTIWDKYHEKNKQKNRKGE